MRMRKKKHGAERLAAVSALFLSVDTLKPGSLAAVFGNHAPCELEIGCGKGSFITALAKQNPHVNYVAMERVSDVILLAAERTAREGLSNIRFLAADARVLPECFAPGEIRTVYLNFSDPWPKKGYAKRRLTHEGFLALYRALLPPGGCVALKTDNTQLFDFSLAEFEKCGFTVQQLTRDLHHSEWAETNIMTEYEQHFASLGMNIHRCVAIRNPDATHLTT